MKQYIVNIQGVVQDTKTNFKCEFEVTVKNGGSVENIGRAIQGAIDRMSDKAHSSSETSKK